MAEVWPEKRVALGVSDRSEWLGSECRGVEELSVVPMLGGVGLLLAASWLAS
jgi:hypothetical protein